MGSTSSAPTGEDDSGPIAVGGGVSLRRHQQIVQQQQSDFRRQQQKDWATSNGYKRQMEQLQNDLALAVAAGSVAVVVTAVGMFVWGRGARNAANTLRDTINHERREAATELDVMRKRSTEEMTRSSQFANQGFAKTLLDVSDNMVRLAILSFFLISSF
jgi:hypothetical protein